MKPLRHGLSVRSKIFGVTFAACTLIIGGTSIYFSRLGLATADQALVAKAATYAQILARDVEPAVAFEDHQTAREAFDAFTSDPDVSGLAVYLGDGRLVESRGEIIGSASAARLDAPPIRVPGSIIARVRVSSREGPRGSAVVQLSTRSLERQVAALSRAALIVGLTALLASLVASWGLARSISRRLSRLATSAAHVVASDLRASLFVDRGTDEIGQLSVAFAHMVEEVRSLVADRAARAAAEQHRLTDRARTMKMLLDSVSDGLAIIGSDGRLGGDRSASFDRWFSARESTHIVDLLRTQDPVVASWFELAWAELGAGVLPVEIVAEQFPSTLCVGDRTYELTVTPIVDENDVFTHAFLLVRDATTRIERARVDANQREVFGLLELSLDDRRAFQEFLAEGNAIVERVGSAAERPLVDVKRDVHTLKGNAGLVGVATVVDACHRLETLLDTEGLAACGPAIAEVRQRWADATVALARVYERTSAGRLEIDRAALDELLRNIEHGLSRRDLTRTLRLFSMEPVHTRLARLAEQGESLGRRLEKSVAVTASADDLHFDTAAWGPFWSALAHAVRNAIHHGIEQPGERVRAGKSERGHVALDAKSYDGAFILDVRDDGGGVDWAAVREKALALGLPAASPDDLREALFADGLSSASEISTVAGRGVGMGALREAATRLGGACTIMSAAGAGTTLRFVFPLASLGEAYRDHQAINAGVSADVA